MAVPNIGKKGAKKDKKSGVLNGKVEKKKEKFNKGNEQATNKLKSFPGIGKKGKNLSNAIKEESVSVSPVSQLSKKQKKEISQKGNNSSPLVSSNAGFSANSKLEKKDKVKKMKKAKNPDKVPEAVTNVSSGKNEKKDKKKKSKKNKKAGNEEKASQPQPQGEKKEKRNVPLTKEQEEKIQARRLEKVKAWHASIDFLLKKKLPKDQVELIKKSKKYTKLPIWKKPYISWVKTDPQYKEQKHGALIKKVYKELKGAERKVKRIKQKGPQKSTLPPQTPKTQAAIERCVQLAASQGADSPVVEKEVGTKETVAVAKQGKAGKNKSANQSNVMNQKKQAENQEIVSKMKIQMNRAALKQEKIGKAQHVASVFNQKKDMKKDAKKFKENGVGKKNKAKFMKKTKQ